MPLIKVVEKIQKWARTSRMWIYDLNMSKNVAMDVSTSPTKVCDPSPTSHTCSFMLIGSTTLCFYWQQYADPCVYWAAN